MKKLQILLPLLLTSLVMLQSCTQSGDCTEVEYDTAFTIVADETYCFPDGAELLINGFNNEFCPCNVDCVWEGQMTLDVEWTDDSGNISEGTIAAHPTNMIESEDLMGLIVNVASQPDSITFITPCTIPDPSPGISGATIIVRD